MREIERNPIAPRGMDIGDPARNHELGIDRACPSDRHGALGSRVDEDRPGGQLRPDLHGLGGGVHEDRRLGAEAPRFHFGSPCVALAPLGEKPRGGCRLEEAPTGSLFVRPRVALQEIGNQIRDAPASPIASRFADRPFDERAVGSVTLVGQDGQEQELAPPNRHFLLKGD